MLFGLLYTHHKVPDAVLKAMLQSVALAGLDAHQLMIVSNRPDPRFPRGCWNIGNDNADRLRLPSGWIPAIYEQMMTGLSALPPGATVCFLEHDVLYPHCYFDVVQDTMQHNAQPNTTYFYTPYRHLDLRPDRAQFGGKSGFWSASEAGTRTFSSGTFGTRQHLMNVVAEKQQRWRTTGNVGGFEPGIDGLWRGVQYQHGLQTVQELPPLLDIRHGTGTNGLPT